MKFYSSLKKLVIIGIAILAFASCQFQPQSKNIDIFLANEWYLGDKLVFRNDSSIAFSEIDTLTNEFINQKSFAIELTDTSLIYTRYQPNGYYDENNEFKITNLEKIIDTVKYDLKYINKKPRLILYAEPFPTILNTAAELSLPETQNFSQIKFMIANYSVGDQIDRSLLKTRGIYNYPNYTIEDCEFIDNKDITFKIIGYNTLYSIERRRIEDYRIKEIVDVVTAKLSVNPEYRPMRQWIEGSDYEYEFYRWSAHGVQINLARSKYVGSASYKTLTGNDSWTLSYDDSFLQAILVETYKNGNPQSSIIK